MVRFTVQDRAAAAVADPVPLCVRPQPLCRTASMTNGWHAFPRRLDKTIEEPVSFDQRPPGPAQFPLRLYVSLDRASHEATLFTDNMTKPAPSSEPMSRRPPLWKSARFVCHPGNWKVNSLCSFFANNNAAGHLSRVQSHRHL